MLSANFKFKDCPGDNSVILTLFLDASTNLDTSSRKAWVCFIPPPLLSSSLVVVAGSNDGSGCASRFLGMTGVLVNELVF